MTSEERFEKYMESLSGEERVQFWEEYDRRQQIQNQGPSNTPQSILAAAHLGGKQPTGESRERFEEAGREAAVAFPLVGLAAAGGAAALAHPWLTAGSVAAGEGTHLGAKALGAGDKTAAAAGFVAALTPSALATKVLRLGDAAATEVKVQTNSLLRLSRSPIRIRQAVGDHEVYLVCSGQPVKVFI